MKRKDFIKSTGLPSTALLFNKISIASPGAAFPVVRTAMDKRKFRSSAVEAAITEFKKGVKNEELGWLFENSFPNTLDTTVTYELKNGKPDTYVITGDIDAMWLRDSTAQVSPYLQFIKQDVELKHLIAGVINRQARCILKDPYANAFYNDDTKVGEWAKDKTDMKAGVHERKWEIDSLCYPIRLAYLYWIETGDTSPFDDNWQSAIKTILRVFKNQQRKSGNGEYHFQRETATATDTHSMAGLWLSCKSGRFNLFSL